MLGLCPWYTGSAHLTQWDLVPTSWLLQGKQADVIQVPVWGDSELIKRVWLNKKTLRRGRAVLSGQRRHTAHSEEPAASWEALLASDGW